ncbi:hypothetical protein [Bradyrhizobium sp.]|uniref:hypothetical protein n=1 Tax=Bradyrhizobium sp. TaxID=376 RepID=UPI0025B9EA20|nr:hypothetical protein [Bradyrhizobium sp.]
MLLPSSFNVNLLPPSGGSCGDPVFELPSTIAYPSADRKAALDFVEFAGQMAADQLFNVSRGIG